MTSSRNTLFIVGPTATGKSELAADVAVELGAEIVSADAFQIYRGLDSLSAKPDAATLAKVPHHLVGTLPFTEEMNAEKFRQLALRAIAEIHSRGRIAIIVGGSGLYIKALTHGLSATPVADPDLRAQLNELSLADLEKKLRKLDPNGTVDFKNRRRVVRAIEISMLSGEPASEQRRWSAGETPVTAGIFVFRERDDLYERINRRVAKIFDDGVIDEVRAAGALSETASKMIGFREIRDLIDGKMPAGGGLNASPAGTEGGPAECIAAIQRATRRYAKRQLTWFRRQPNFQPLNLSVLSHVEAVKRISQVAKTFGIAQGND